MKTSRYQGHYKQRIIAKTKPKVIASFMPTIRVVIARPIRPSHPGTRRLTHLQLLVPSEAGHDLAGRLCFLTCLVVLELSDSIKSCMQV